MFLHPRTGLGDIGKGRPSKNPDYDPSKYPITLKPLNWEPGFLPPQEETRAGSFPKTLSIGDSSSSRKLNGDVYSYDDPTTRSDSSGLADCNVFDPWTYRRCVQNLRQKIVSAPTREKDCQYCETCDK
ncbi:hypothetical protein AUF78_04270 [archaeon 13_1_20CM_2_51_12]|nr:MAG: hypothetical protein AUF78_04270 [archaeon 13_1_20CM_2_51_12]